MTVSHTSGGTVTIDNTAVTSGTAYSVSSTAGTTLAASVNSGYTFLGWVNTETNALLSASASYTFTPKANMGIKAVFVNTTSDTAWFMASRTAGDQYLYDDLSDAVTKAGTLSDKTVVLMNNGTLTGEHTIPSGVTLLIPNDAAGTVYTTTPGDGGTNSYTSPTVYRTLTMAANSGITVADGGAISIAGKIGTFLSSSDSTTPPFTNGAPSGPLGYIYMNNGSGITINNGGNLYAWGFITGSNTSSVTVKSGGNVYEDLQIRDYRGGEDTTSMISNQYKVFPFSQYYIQNIEVPLTLEAGATESVCMAVTYRPLITSYVAKENAIFVGDTNTGLIRLTSGSMTRTYDGSTDRIIYDLNGDIGFGNLNVSINLSSSSKASIDSKDYVMPINGNMTLNVKTGSTVSVNQDFALLPGVILNIEKDATVTLASGKKIVVYDTEIEWASTDGTALEEKTAWTPGYCGYMGYDYVEIQYAPGKASTAKRSWLDAQVVVNGTLDASNGYIYTTTYSDHNANICSTGNGKVITGAAGADTETYVFYQDNRHNLGIENVYIGLSISPAKLLNGDNSTYVETDSAAGTYTYYTSTGRWDRPSHFYDETDPVVTAPTCTEDGYTTHTCAVCGDSYSDTELPATGIHTYESGVCTGCGRYNITFTVAHNLNLLDLVQIGYWVNVTTEADLTDAKYGILIWTEEDFNAESNHTIDSPTAQKHTLSYRQGYYYAYGNGILAQKLDTVYYAIPYVVISDTYVYAGSPDVYSVLDYAAAAMDSNSGVSDSVRNVVRDLLNYATAVQNYFNVRQGNAINDTPINACLSADDRVSRYDQGMLVEAVTASKNPENTESAYTWKDYATVNLDEAISINFFAEPGEYAGMLYWTAAAYNSAETLSFENKSNVLAVSSRTMTWKGNEEQTSCATVGGIFAKDIADWHYVCMYAGSEGSYTYSTVKVDSVAAYLTRMISEYGDVTDGETAYLVAACKNMLAYGESASAYADGN